MKIDRSLSCLILFALAAQLSAAEPDNISETSKRESDRGLIQNYIDSSPYALSIAWISDVDDEFELQDGSRWFLTDDPNALNWHVGDQVTFAPRYDFQDALPVRRPHKKDRYYALLTRIADPERALIVSSVHPNTLRLVLSDGSIWQAENIGPCALCQMFQSDDIVTVSPVKHLLFDEMMIINQTRFPFAITVELKKAGSGAVE